MPAHAEALADRLARLEAEVRRLRRTALALALALFGLATCAMGDYSTSTSQEQLGLLMAHEIRVGDPAAAVHITGAEVQLRRADGRLLVLDAAGLHLRGPDGADRVALVAEPPALTVLAAEGPRTWP
ncbi:MAG TPA: hypothetical protein PKW35_25190 [Nannocystaceae bacterium]|nr:hypothetical protein [Nannocystaceae bacterium]